MNYLKSLVRPIFQSRYGIWWRNIIGFRPVKTRHPNSLSNYSISDAFPWRTHDGYVTHFRFSDIPKIYFNVDKLQLNIYWKIIKYFFRTTSYLLILNFKNSLKNFLKLFATINYILFK